MSDISRAFAFAVFPQKNVSPARAPEGGTIKVPPTLDTVLRANLKEARFDRQPTAIFNVDPGTRSCDVRDAIVAFAFGSGSQARAAGLSLADRLGAAMDRRSPAALLLLVVFGTGALRKTVLWIFPNEEAFQLRRGKGEPAIELLRDVFSQKSKQRKAAMFDGRNVKSEYLSGRILDFQAGSRRQDVADFFIAGFLDCTLAVTPEIGSHILAETIKETHKRLQTPAEREQLYAAVVAVRNTPQPRLSLRDFASRYLNPDVSDVFLAQAPNEEMAHTAFTFTRAAFDEVLQFRVFELSNGLFVYSPLTEVGRAVRIDGTKLSCEGTIEGERLRTKHG